MATVRIYYPNGITGVSQSYGSETLSVYSQQSIPDRGVSSESGTSGGDYTVGDTLTVSVGTRVKFSAVPNTGMKFVGWFDSSTPNTAMYALENYVVTVNGDMSLYPKYQVNQSSVSKPQISVKIDRAPVGEYWATVSSMYGYRSYTITDTNLHNYNGSNDPLEVLDSVAIHVKNIDGYDTAVYYTTGGDTPVPVYPTTDRGSSTQYDDQSITMYNVPVSGTTSITVLYTPTSPFRKVTFRTQPSNGGTIQYRITGTERWNSVPSSGYISVQADTVDVRAVPNAGYTFSSFDISDTAWNSAQQHEQQGDRGVSEVENRSSQNPMTLTLDGDKWITVNFANNSGETLNVNTVSINSQSVGGTVTIKVNGTPISGTTLNQSTLSAGQTVTIEATPVSGHVFLYWLNNSTSEPIQYSSQKSTLAPFAYDTPTSVTMTAVFAAVSKGCVLVPMYVEIEGTQQTSRVPGLKYMVRYTNSTGVESTETVETSYVGSLDYNVVAKKTVDGQYQYIDLAFNRPTYEIDSSGTMWRYAPVSVEYIEGCAIDGDTDTVWNTCTLDGSGGWRLYIGTTPDPSDASISEGEPCTVRTVYSKTRLYSITIEAYPSDIQSPQYPEGNVWVSNDGGTTHRSIIKTYAAENETLSLSTGTIYSNAYTFTKWTLKDSTSTVSSNPSFTYTMPSRPVHIQARWISKNILNYSVSGTVAGTSISCVDHEGTSVASGSRVEFGEQLTFTVDPSTGSVSYWTAGETRYDNQQSTFTYVNLNPGTVNLEVQCYVSGAANISLTVTDHGNGTTVVESSMDREEWNVMTPESTSQTGTETTCGYSLTYGAYVRTTASVSSPRTKFSQFIMNYNGTTTTSNSQPMVTQSLEHDATIDTIYTETQWLSTLATIIKVW